MARKVIGVNSIKPENSTGSNDMSWKTLAKIIERSYRVQPNEEIHTIWIDDDGITIHMQKKE